MKRRVWSLLLASSLVLSLASCSKAPAATTPAPSKAPEVKATTAPASVAPTQGATTDIPEERDPDTMSSTFSLGFMGLDANSNTYFMATDEDVTYAAFVILSADGTQSLNAVGEVIEDGSYLTVNDTYSGYSITFSVESADGVKLLTLKDGTEIVMADADVATVLDIIVAIDNGTEIVAPQVGDETSSGAVAVEFTDAMSAESSNGSGVMMLTNADTTYCAIAMVNADSTLAQSYVGPCTMDTTEYVLSVTDATTGESFQTMLIPSTDESGNPFALMTTDGETGFAMYPCDISDGVAVMSALGIPVA